MPFRTRLTVIAAVAFVASAVPGGAASAQSLRTPLPTVTRTVLITADIQRLKRFYVEGFSFRPTFEGVVGGDRFGPMLSKAWHLGPKGKLYGVVLRAPRGDTELGLTSARGQTLKSLARPTNVAPMSGNHYLILQVADLDATLRRLKPFNPKFSRPPMKLVDAEGLATYEAALFDPDGTLVIAVQEH